jgi:hypothetical protein
MPGFFFLLLVTDLYSRISPIFIKIRDTKKNNGDFNVYLYGLEGTTAPHMLVHGILHMAGLM